MPYTPTSEIEQAIQATGRHPRTLAEVSGIPDSGRCSGINPSYDSIQQGTRDYQGNLINPRT